ncbi:glutathione S-transferase family protein [Phenylobacterium montanum]|uniref:Glutathione S-transferase family protein n=1 Tax=Phenylobacterium montanum TaxID=2823693 RepID=A0A975G155_9CAUL|nr:glutathione S-transferase family protein [Caulobacter sp. S6]QUD89195.1 glutathione S-transferase family protein [Caulobacter sp. S6]
MSRSPVTLHTVPGSPYGRVVMIALEEKGASYRIAPLAFGDHKKPNYLALQPFGRIPVLDDGDFRLYETQAILRYVDRAFEGPALQPKEPKALARMDQLMNIIDWYLFPQVTVTIPYQRIVVPLMLGGQPDEAVVAEGVPKARHCVGAIEDLMAGQPFLTGDNLSLADIMMFTHIDYLAATPEGREILEGRPLLAWLGRMQARDSVKATNPPAQPAAA